jgi:hypothetical protein
VTICTFISIEVYNVIVAVGTGGSYFDPVFTENFLVNKVVNLAVSAAFNGFVMLFGKPTAS